MQLKREGVIRAAGVGNYDSAQLAEFVGKAPEEIPAVNQVQWHLGYHDEHLFQTMQSMNITMMAWGALGTFTPNMWGTGGVQMDDPRLKEMATKYGISTAQVALRWQIQRGVAPVTSTCNERHALQDLTAFADKLKEDDVTYLDSLKVKSV